MHHFFCIWLSTWLSARSSARLPARLSAGLSARLSAQLSARLSDRLSAQLSTWLSAPLSAPLSFLEFSLWQSNCNTYIFYCLIAIFRGKFTRQWNILSNILWCYLYNYFLVEHFRSPSCMAISRSYPRHLVKFPEKKAFYHPFGHPPIICPIICPFMHPIISLVVHPVI